MDGLVFGLLDNGIVLFGAYLGLSIEDRLSSKLSRDSNPVLGAALGATIGNLISDFVGACVDPSMQHMKYGIALGCIIPILFIPIIEKIRRKVNDYKDDLYMDDDF